MCGEEWIGVPSPQREHYHSTPFQCDECAERIRYQLSLSVVSVKMFSVIDGCMAFCWNWRCSTSWVKREREKLLCCALGQSMNCDSFMDRFELFVEFAERMQSRYPAISANYKFLLYSDENHFLDRIAIALVSRPICTSTISFSIFHFSSTTNRIHTYVQCGQNKTI